MRASLVLQLKFVLGEKVDLWKLLGTVILEGVEVWSSTTMVEREKSLV